MSFTENGVSTPWLSDQRPELSLDVSPIFIRVLMSLFISTSIQFIHVFPPPPPPTPPNCPVLSPTCGRLLRVTLLESVGGRDGARPMESVGDNAHKCLLWFLWAPHHTQNTHCGDSQTWPKCREWPDLGRNLYSRHDHWLTSGQEKALKMVYSIVALQGSAY